MSTLIPALQAMGYALLSIGAILGLIFVLMKLVGRLMSRKKPAADDDASPANPADGKEAP